MSNHHTQRAINLHHDQVSTGRNRRLQRRVDRVQGFLASREEARFEYNCMLVCGFVNLVYTVSVIMAHMGYILSWA